MQKIKQYKVVCERQNHHLEEIVNKKIAEGWIPFGGVHYDDTTNYWKQGMILCEDADRHCTAITEKDIPDDIKYECMGGDKCKICDTYLTGGRLQCHNCYPDN